MIYLLLILLIPVYIFIFYIITSLVPINEKKTGEKNKYFFLYSDQIHVDIIIPKKYFEKYSFSGIYFNTNEQFISFGWGDMEFYYKTPTIKHLNFKTAFRAFFLKTPTLIHVKRYQTANKVWKKIAVSSFQLEKILEYLNNSFETDSQNKKIKTDDLSYWHNDNFYLAKGSYFFFNTCNTWVNNALKFAGMKACLQTPYSFGIMLRYK